MSNIENSTCPKELKEMISHLDKNSSYGLMCHSSKLDEVKSWYLPYKIMCNEWYDKALPADTSKVYIIPIDTLNKPLSIRYE